MDEQAGDYLAAVERKDADGAKKSFPMMSDKDADKLFTGKYKGNIGMPPYHFRCRTITVVSFERPDYVDNLGRGYTASPDVKKKIDREHVRGTKYKNSDRLVRKTLSQVSKEGVHTNDPTKRVLLGDNGFIVFADKEGRIATVFKPDRNALAYYDEWAEPVFDKVAGILKKGLKRLYEKVYFKYRKQH